MAMINSTHHAANHAAPNNTIYDRGSGLTLSMNPNQDANYASEDANNYANHGDGGYRSQGTDYGYRDAREASIQEANYATPDGRYLNQGVNYVAQAVMGGNYSWAGEGAMVAANQEVRGANYGSIMNYAEEEEEVEEEVEGEEDIRKKNSSSTEKGNEKDGNYGRSIGIDSTTRKSIDTFGQRTSVYRGVTK